MHADAEGGRPLASERACARVSTADTGDDAASELVALHELGHDGAAEGDPDAIGATASILRPDFGGSNMKVLFTKSRQGSLCPTSCDRG